MGLTWDFWGFGIPGAPSPAGDGDRGLLTRTALLRLVCRRPRRTPSTVYEEPGGRSCCSPTPRETQRESAACPGSAAGVQCSGGTDTCRPRLRSPVSPSLAGLPELVLDAPIRLRVSTSDLCLCCKCPDVQPFYFMTLDLPRPLPHPVCLSRRLPGPGTRAKLRLAE